MRFHLNHRDQRARHVETTQWHTKEVPLSLAASPGTQLICCPAFSCPPVTRRGLSPLSCPAAAPGAAGRFPLGGVRWIFVQIHFLLGRRHPSPHTSPIPFLLQKEAQKDRRKGPAPHERRQSPPGSAPTLGAAPLPPAPCRHSPSRSCSARLRQEPSGRRVPALPRRVPSAHAPALERRSEPDIAVDRGTSGTRTHTQPGRA